MSIENLAEMLRLDRGSGAQERKSDRFRQELSNKYLVAKLGFEAFDREEFGVQNSRLAKN